MKLSPRQKVLLGVMGVFVLALAADKLVLRPGTGGAIAAAAATTGVPDDDQVSITAVSTTQGPTLAQRLKALRRGAWDGGIRDAFTPGEGLIPRQASSPGPVVVQAEPGERFAESHTLTGVAPRATGGTAIVNGHTVRVGERVDGFRLVRVHADSALFEREGRHVEIRIRRDLR